MFSTFFLLYLLSAALVLWIHFESLMYMGQSPRTLFQAFRTIEFGIAEPEFLELKPNCLA